MNTPHPLVGKEIVFTSPRTNLQERGTVVAITRNPDRVWWRRKGDQSSLGTHPSFMSLVDGNKVEL